MSIHSGERAMRIRRTLCATALLCGLGLGALAVSQGCGAPPEGARGELSDALKERSAAHGKRMKEFYDAKKANKAATKGNPQ
jgi:hypothetical protein